jgi:hypothetical protein
MVDRPEVWGVCLWFVPVALSGKTYPVQALLPSKNSAENSFSSCHFKGILKGKGRSDKLYQYKENDYINSVEIRVSAVHDMINDLK